jgi:hypothetical protein
VAWVVLLMTVPLSLISRSYLEQFLHSSMKARPGAAGPDRCMASS